MQLPDNELYLTNQRFEKIPTAVKDRKYDIIVVDGGIRVEAAKIATDLIADDAIIIFDDSAEESTPFHKVVPEMMSQAGWKRVDFDGFGPGALRECCSSIYWKSDAFFATPDPPPASVDSYGR